MTKILDIAATTTDEQIEDAITFLDMREHAIELRDAAAAVIAEQGDQKVLELHNIDGVIVLFSPIFAYAYVNEYSPGVGNSLVLDNEQAPSAEAAATRWTKA